VLCLGSFSTSASRSSSRERIVAANTDLLLSDTKLLSLRAPFGGCVGSRRRTTEARRLRKLLVPFRARSSNLCARVVAPKGMPLNRSLYAGERLN
jgi:hypothetical protein